jgi:thiol-disulfide isomerase/thioredoxin
VVIGFDSLALCHRSIIILMKILKFSADWCNPCKQLAKSIEESGVTVPVEEFDIDKQPDMAKAFNIRSVPTLIVLGENNIQLGRKSGSLTPAQYKSWIESL